MKTVIKVLSGLLLASIIGVGVLYLLSLWQIVPIPFLTAWKIVGTVAGLIGIVLLCWLCVKTFFCKSNRGDKSRGNKARPVRS
jgi:hypothetical protein